ncbi:MAG: hypothetical protein WD825_01420 [Gemmatimonadaceae bacterium]
MACDAPPPTDPMVELSSSSASAVDLRVIGHANGEGVIDVGVPMDFVMTALLRADGSASGEAFHHALLGSNVIEFRTRVTCVSFDPVNNRAWIGGVITENNSTDPARMQERNQVGRDIWWRMVDYGNGGSGTVDRSTFLGFTGDAGFQTSAAYCAGQPWPGPNDTPPQPVDARTGPLLSGNISIELK